MLFGSSLSCRRRWEGVVEILFFFGLWRDSFLVDVVVALRDLICHSRSDHCIGVDCSSVGECRNSSPETPLFTMAKISESSSGSRIFALDCVR